MKKIMCLKALCIGALFFIQLAIAEPLPENLVSWSHANPVIKVGVDGTLPPFDYIDEEGKPSGAGFLIRQQLSNILPIDLQATSITTFQNEYKQLLQGRTDAISICARTPQRNDEVLYSTPLFQMTPILVVNNKSGILSEADVTKKHSISAIKGNATESYISSLTPKNIEVPDNLTAYQKIDNGEIDGFISYLYFYKYMTNKHKFKNLRPVAMTQFKELNIGFCIHKKKPELVEVINWGIEQLGEDFILKSQNQWTKSTKSFAEHENLSNKYSSNFGAILTYSLIIALVFILLVLVIAKRFANDIAIKLDTRLFKFSFFSILLTILILLIGVSKVYLDNFKQRIHNDQQETLEDTQEVIERVLKSWYDERKNIVKNIAQSQTFSLLVNTLINAEKSNNESLLTTTQNQLHEYFKQYPFVSHSSRAYTVSNTQGTYLLNFIREAEGKPSTIKKQRPELYNAVLNGSTEFIPPVWANIEIDGNLSENDKDPEIFISTPVYNDNKDIIAVFSVRFDPGQGFSRLFIDGRLGKSFESYAIDSRGYIISESRFSTQLQEEGIISFGESTILNVQLPEPHTNPIVNAAKFKIDGQNLEGYNDFRGKKSIGQWIAFDEFNFTVVTEVDYDEVYSDYYNLRDVLFLGLIISSALVLSLTIFMITISKRANEINQRSQNELSKQVEERTLALEESELKSKLINSSVADGILGVDNTGKIIFANQSAANLLKSSEEEILSHDLISLFGETDPSIKTFEDTNIYTAIKENRIIRAQQGELKVKFDFTFSVETSISPVNNSKTELAAVIVFRDITERLQATERVEKMLENLPVSMVVIDKDDIIEQINQTGIELLGFSKEEMLKNSIEKFIPEDQVANHQALLATLFEEEKVIDTHDLNHTFKVKHKSGKLIDIQAVYTPVRFYDGMYAVVMIRDVTADKLAEQALIDAKQMSDDASKAKSDFLANMSHEIRTPMNAIMGMSHLALGCGLERKPKNYITKVYNAAESLLGIINDILDFSKIEAGKLDLEHIDFNLHEVFDDLSTIVGLKTFEKNLELLFDISPNIPLMLVGDPLRLNQILINIAGNAVKFTDNGQVVISAKLLHADSDDQLTLEFSVKDSGIGMNEEQISNLFQSFSQADSSTTRKYGGTGLGLTISKKLVELMDGDIWLESEEGIGSTFFFTANFKKSTLNSNVLSTEEQHSFLSDKRILIVDDNPIAVDVLKSIMESFHCKVVTANSGQEAIDIAKQSTLPFDVIMVDWKMPDLDGIETCNIIKAQNNYDDTHFILVTSSARDESSIEELSKSIKSIKSIIMKPVTPSSVFDEIMRLHGEEVISATRDIKRDDKLQNNQRLLQHANILLVEDNELNQELALELLKQSGIHVTLAENGKQATEKVHQDTFDGILMDIQMPVMDGYTATKIIRQSFPELPIIAMTANAMAGDKEKVLAAGMNDHITKPLNVNAMFSTIAKWITPQSSSSNNSLPIIPVEENSVQDIEELPHFEHINVEAGMLVTNGNKKLYIKLLNKFMTGQGEFNQEFEEAIANNEQETATRVVHTLKGSAGNIGAKNLQEQAGKLEKTCNDMLEKALLNKADLSEHLASVNSALEKVLDELAGYFAHEKTKESINTETKFIANSEIKGQLSQLLELVADFETDAVELAEEILDQLQGSNKADSFEVICQQIEGYKFTEAEESLIKFIDHIDASTEG